MAGGGGRISSHVPSAWHHPVFHFFLEDHWDTTKEKNSYWVNGQRRKENLQAPFGFFATIKWSPLVQGSRHEKKQDLISSLGCTLVCAPASAQQCIRAQQEQGERGWWKGINNTYLNRQGTGKGTHTVHQLQSTPGHFCECGNSLYWFIPRLQP